MKLKFKIFYAFICFFTASVAFAQDGLVLTAEENQEWIKDLKAKNNLVEQLNMLSQRIISDTAVTYSSTRFICFTGLSDEKQEEIKAKEKKKAKEKPGQQLQSRHRPLYQFVKNRESIPLGAIKKARRALKLAEFLSPAKVESVEIFYDQPENVLYGERGESGVVLIELKDEKTFQRLREVLY